jgi:transposase
MAKKRNSSFTKSQKAVLKKINYDVSGIDLSSQDMYIAVIDKDVQVFSTFTSGLHSASLYLKSEKIRKIVMEATGVYWIPVFEHFEKEGFEVTLVNGAHAKNVPGRKTDVLDSEWLRELHTFGLLRGSFIPGPKIRELRYYVRLRDDHISMGAAHINLIQKNLDMMNIKLHKVLDSIMSKSGQLIVQAILKGQRDPLKLWELCEDYIDSKKKAAVIESLTGNYRAEYLFGIKQAYSMWEQYQSMLKQCDSEIEKLLSEMTLNCPKPEGLGHPKSIKKMRL